MKKKATNKSKKPRQQPIQRTSQMLAVGCGFCFEIYVEPDFSDSEGFEPIWVAYTVKFNFVAQGKTKEEAVERLEEAIRGQIKVDLSRRCYGSELYQGNQ